MHKWTNEEICFLREMAPGRSYRELHKIVQESFDILVTKSALNGTLKRYGIRNGIDQTFKKNHVPHNKGQGGIHYPGSEKGWFQKGNIPWNYKPIGAERINQEGISNDQNKRPKCVDAQARITMERTQWRGTAGTRGSDYREKPHQSTA